MNSYSTNIKYVAAGLHILCSDLIIKMNATDVYECIGPHKVNSS